ncbi:hypothetical protein FQN57_000262 [Myotisia sp. PD_48]|nr:hypothetical protein FQN57_000262 [Myotisia sp. PD_48]
MPSSASEEPPSTPASSISVAQSPGSTSDDILNSLSSVEGERLLAFIDEIRGANFLGQVDLDLPQLVVVGNTSCGKSSLLQAITNLPFPVDNGICTRFATETRIHRCPASRPPRYKITFETQRNQDTPFTPLEYSGEDWQATSRQLLHDLKTAFESANIGDSATGFSSENSHRLGSRSYLTDDIMRVDVYKPDQAHFSVVDIPGLVTGGSGHDKQLSEKLAKRYMKNPRAIVLAVMPAVDDILNQPVLRLIQEVKAMERTIGVISKCDVLQPKDESKVIGILQNTSSDHKLNLGWFAIRNRTTTELEAGISPHERDIKEMELFNQPHWSSVSPDRIGISNLRACLSRTLYKHVKGTFPGVIGDIETKLQTTRERLGALGLPRESFRLQQVFLDNIQRVFGSFMSEWLGANYDDDCDMDGPCRLRAHLNDLEEEFEQNIRVHGTTHEFVGPGNDILQRLDYVHHPDSWEQRMKAGNDIFSWILDTWNTNRGDGLWYKPPANLEEKLWKVQVASWKYHADNFLKAAIEKIQKFLDVLFERACPDESIRGKIRRALVEETRSAIQGAYDELDKIVSELARMKTCYRKFKYELDAAQKALVSNALIQVIADSKLRTILSVHENLRGFWSVALLRFVDNVVIQVIERHLLSPNTGLIHLFSVDWVQNLTEKQLIDLVGENLEVRRQREDCSWNLLPTNAGSDKENWHGVLAKEYEAPIDPSTKNKATMARDLLETPAKDTQFKSESRRFGNSAGLTILARLDALEQTVADEQAKSASLREEFNRKLELKLIRFPVLMSVSKTDFRSEFREKRNSFARGGAITADIIVIEDHRSQPADFAAMSKAFHTMYGVDVSYIPKLEKGPFQLLLLFNMRADLLLLSSNPASRSLLEKCDAIIKLFKIWADQEKPSVEHIFKVATVSSQFEAISTAFFAL